MLGDKTDKLLSELQTEQDYGIFLAAQMSGAFVAFARSGNPNHAGLPQWPTFTTPTRATMVFENDRSVVRNDPDAEARRLI